MRFGIATAQALVLRVAALELPSLPAHVYGLSRE